MHHLDTRDWLKTPNGELRGYIQPESLKELWFHTGTNCNLRCPFCFEGSKPGDNRINFLTFGDVKPYIDEAMSLGVEKFSFTGGEPFVNPSMVEILGYALNHRPCLVLTNATEPLMNRIHEILPLKSKSNSLSFRVSIDHADEKIHDCSRGKGNFARSFSTLRKLYENDFGISIARLIQNDEDVAAVNENYRTVFSSRGLPRDTRIVAFPDFFLPGSVPEVPHLTENCMTEYLNNEKRRAFMCNFSKMVVKKNNRVGVYACTLVDDDADYDLGSTLSESMKVRVMLRHHRCYSCFAYGASCSEN